MKRLISCTASDFASMTPQELKVAIFASAGRSVMSETIVAFEPLMRGLTNAEVASAFGADLILLNFYDVLNPTVLGLPGTPKNPIAELKRLIGRPVGINLEPIGTGKALETIEALPPGRRASEETFLAAEAQGADYICLTGNPGTGVTNDAIEEAVRLCRKCFSGLIIAGKMHGAGIDEEVFDTDAFARFIKAGADIILIPAPGTVPGISEQDAAAAVRAIHQNGALALSAIGTSQEGADAATVREIALSCKRAGVDIQHIGDAAACGMADPENILTLSIAIRGKRHTVFRMAGSVLR